MAGLSLAATTIKPTFAPLYVGYYLLRRSGRLVAAFFLAVGLLTTLPLLLTGRPLIETITGALRLVQPQTIQSIPGGVNDPSPFAPYSVAMVHLMPLVYRIFNAQSSTATAISVLVILMLGGLIAYLIHRSRPSERTDLLDFGLVSALSLLSIYHRQNDLFLLFPGLIYLYLHTVNLSDRTARQRWGAFVVFVLLLLNLPLGVLPQLSIAHSAVFDNYLIRLIAPFQTWAGIAVLSALLWLKVQMAPREQKQSLRTVEG